MPRGIAKGHPSCLKCGKEIYDSNGCPQCKSNNMINSSHGFAKGEGGSMSPKGLGDNIPFTTVKQTNSCLFKEE